MKILGLILAKANSKGLKKKNFLKIGKFSLTEIAMKNAKKSKLITRLIFSSDSKKLIKLAKKNLIEVPFLRPKALTRDKSSSYDVAKHAVSFLKKKEYWTPDYIVVLQPTTPFRKSKDIDRLISLTLKTNSEAGMAITKNLYSPFWSLKIDKKNKLKPIWKKGFHTKYRQGLPKTYKPSGSIYILKTRLLRTIKGILPKKNTVAIEVSNFDSINIDSYEDYNYAKYLYKINKAKLDI